jgi:hypothetical protein
MKRIFSLLCVFCVAISVHPQSIKKGDTVVPWSAGLRIRENASVSARVSGTAGLWENLIVLDVSAGVQTIAGNTGSWIQVRRPDGRTGYAFSYFLVPVSTDDFFPVLAYNESTEEIYTFYNDRRSRDKLSLSWEGRRIDRFPRMAQSADGTVIAFTWLDPRSVQHPSPETYSGKRILFVYEFSTHRLIKVDEAGISESDSKSAYWERKLSALDGDSISFSDIGFVTDRQLNSYCLNHDGSKIFYYREDLSCVEFDLTTGGRTQHEIPSKFYLPRYFGAYLYLDFESDYRNNKYYRTVYDPVRKRVLYNDLFDYELHSGEGFSLVNILRDRYLFIVKDPGGTCILRDMLTNTEREIPVAQNFSRPLAIDGETVWLADIDGSSNDGYFTHQTIRIQKADYTGAVLPYMTYNFPLDGKNSQLSPAMHPFSGGIMVVNEYSRWDNYSAWAYYLLPDGTIKKLPLTESGIRYYDYFRYYPMKSR